MANNPKGNPSSLKPIQPGEVRNPKGGSRKASLKKALGQLSKQEMEEVGKLILSGKLRKLEAIVKDAGKDGKKNQSVLKTLFASVAIKAISKGDYNALNMLLDRLIGKVPAPVQLTNPDGSLRPQVILTLPDNGRRAKPSDEPTDD